MTPNQTLAEGLAVLGTLDPASQAAGTVTTNWVSAQNFHAFMALLMLGALGASGTIDAKIQQAQDGSGTNAKDISGKAITQITQAGGGSSKQALISFRAADLDTNNGFSYVRLSVTVGTAASLLGAALLGGYPRFEPVRDLTATPQINLGAASVAQVI